MLRHSYKVEAMRLRTTMKALELDLLNNPRNKRAAEQLATAQKELDWYETMIRNGKDPGMKVL